MKWKMAFFIISLPLLLSPLWARAARNNVLKLQGKVPVRTSVQMYWDKNGVVQPMIQTNAPEYPSKKIRLKRQPASSGNKTVIIEAP